MITNEGIEKHARRMQVLKNRRNNWESHWQEITELCIPRKSDIITTRTPGTKKMTKVFDSTALQAVELLAAGLNSFLTSTVNRWFSLRTAVEELMDHHEVKVWLEDVEKKMYSVFNTSNFGNEMHEIYMDLGTIGTGSMYIAEDDETICRFHTRHIAETFIDEGADGRINTMYRSFRYTSRQAAEMFGEDNLSKAIKENLKGKPDDYHEFVHIVGPRDDRDFQAVDALNMPWASLYVESKTKHLISEGGYNDFPFVVPRWLKGTQETYGRSPAMAALPDIKMLNKMSESEIKAGQKVVDPPYAMPSDGVIGSVKLNAGGLTAVRWDMFNKPGQIFQPLFTGANFPISFEMTEQRRNSIRKTFFTDLFLLIMERPQMTATEVVERNEEKMALLSPILGRLMSEMLNPLIDRVFGIMLRRGMFGPPPQILRGQDLRVEYVSPLARAQKLWEVKSIEKTLLQITPLAADHPELWDNYNLDKTARYLAEANGYPQELLNPKTLVAEIRQRRAQVEAEETQKQDLAQMADSGSKLLKATDGGKNVVSLARQAA